MKPQAQIRAIAELDGCQIQHENRSGFNLVLTNGDIVTVWNNGEICGDVNHYYEKLLTSRDAIVPVIEKCWQNQTLFSGDFIETLKKITHNVTPFELCIRSTSQQLCEALLRATGKWIEV